MAEANKLRLVMEAEAEAEAIKIRGEAEAFAIEAKAKAEAEQMAKKAVAWNEYRSAAMIDMMLDTLPKVYINVYNALYIYYHNLQHSNLSINLAGGRRSSRSSLPSKKDNHGFKRKRHYRRRKIDGGGLQYCAACSGTCKEFDRRGYCKGIHTHNFLKILINAFYVIEI